MAVHEQERFGPTGVRHRGALYGFAPASALSSSRLAANLHFPALADWWPVMDRLDLSDEVAVRAAAAAERSGSDICTELLASGHVDEERLCRAAAEEFGLGFQRHLDADEVAVADAIAMEMLRERDLHRPIQHGPAPSNSFIYPPSRLGSLPGDVARFPDMVDRFTAVTRKTLRAALIGRVSETLVESATYDLFTRYPDYSARIVANAWQGIVIGILAVGLPVAIVSWPTVTFVALHVCFTLFFLSCVVLRFLAVKSGAPLEPAPTPMPSPTGYPTYTVLVALYREAEVVPQLMEALGQLVWPTAKLEIKFVCEADDLQTIAAIEAGRLHPSMEVIAVPASGPRTKPKALSFALQVSSGELVVLYDAEDRPHPHQLVEAWREFQAGGERLGCVQAPLDITNSNEGPIARLFAFEYAALFRGLLPWLSQRKLLLPLGGTSNHFRRCVLEEIGGWDPFNVTEDADLGVRLARFGYQTQTISSPTEEDAPTDFRTWLPQRTRWFKGWLQTWLVHMRAPGRLWRELGPRSFIIAQILFGGMVVSALIHPVLIVTVIVIASDLIQQKPISTLQSALLIVDVINVACGYVSFLLLGWQTLARHERRGFWKVVAFTPVYWMMMSIAAWRSVLHLWKMPHLWEKTPHGRRVVKGETEMEAEA